MGKFWNIAVVTIVGTFQSLESTKGLSPLLSAGADREIDPLEIYLKAFYYRKKVSG
jgi:hypothetical protein